MIRKDKYFFCHKKILFLGHIIIPNGIQPNDALTCKVKDFSVPQNIKTIQSFLGLSGYYRQFIKDYAKIALPLTRLTRKKYFLIGLQNVKKLLNI